MASDKWEVAMAVQSYRDLIVWQKSISFVTDVYRTTKCFPGDEKYGLTAQLRRTAVAIASNIAEGQGRLSTGEFMQFLGRARGSLHEVQTQLYIANNLGFLACEDEQHLLSISVEIDKMISGLLSSLR